MCVCIYIGCAVMFNQTLCRNKEKLTGLDESSGMPVAMEGLNIINEIECNMACSSSKVQYIMKFSVLGKTCYIFVYEWSLLCQWFNCCR